ncbi:ABC transporter substrate-binding protein [Nonomuraea sp. NPDC003804]|uniref:ABC transporter substrate-binding protein n=1 Tax=Nonomuraea sp. NPDC003804 TaxID=3154547 RepID=UPI0033A9B939
MRPLRPGDPRVVGVYEVTGFLGEGGQGSVYRGVAPSGEPVAIKMLHARFADDASAVRRFRREAEAARRVAEFCTARVLEVGALDDQPYIVSEYVAGPSLQRQVAESGPLTGSSLVRLAVATATALAAIHRAGVVHRDLKPSNVLLAPDGPRVIDFGIARALDVSQSLTTSVVGTPAYMAPEHFHGDASPASDVFSWAGTMVYAATGRGAFGFGPLPVVMHRILVMEPDLSGVEAPLRELLGASLGKDPAARPTAEQLLRELIRAGSGPQAPPYGTAPPPAPASAPPYGTAPPPAPVSAPPYGMPAPAGPSSAPPYGTSAPPVSVSSPYGTSAPPVSVSSPYGGGPGPHAPGWTRPSQGATTPVTAAPYPGGGQAPGTLSTYPVSGAVGRPSGRAWKVLLPVGAAAMTVVLGVAVWAWPRLGQNSGTGGEVTATPSPTRTAAVFNAALTGVVNPSARKGGTLRIGMTNSLDNLDPAGTFYTEMWNYARLYGRALTMYRPAPGTAGTEVVPDLAAKLGETTDNGRTWTFTLREGLRFEDGTPITSRDVKYAVVRSGDRRLLPNGPDPLARLLDMPGRYTAADADKAISTPDDRTIVFRLKKPMSTFNQIATLPVTMPVRKGAAKLLSSGPYKLDIQAGKTATFVRNPAWNQATDPNRTALPDRVELTWGMDGEEADRKLLSGELDLHAGPLPATLATVRADQRLNARADAPSLDHLRYLAVNTRVAPLDQPACRRAVLAAIDKSVLHRLYGDGPFGTEIATRLQPPPLPGRGELDGPSPTATAAPSPASCGRDPFTLLVRNGPTDVAAGNAIRDNLTAAGFHVTVKNVDVLHEFDKLGNPAALTKEKIGLVMRRWSGDWPDPDPLLSQLIDSREIVDSGFSANVGVRLPEVDALIDESRRTLDPQARFRLWREAERRVLEEGLMVPLLWSKAGLIRGKRVTNAHVSSVYQHYDVTTIGVTG